jgi:predicted RNase H-like HicB family nuclease
MKDYHVNVFYSGEDECYIADIPDLKYCTGFGKTPFEAMQDVETARQAWIETVREMGREIPKPTYRPAFHQIA